MWRMLWLQLGLLLLLRPQRVPGLTGNDMLSYGPPDGEVELDSNRDGLRCMDCSPNDRLMCSVSVGGCNELSRMNNRPSYPGYPTNLKVESFMRAYNTSDGSFNEMGMNISFGLPQLGMSTLDGFFITVNMLKSTQSNEKHCIALNLAENFTLTLQDQDVRFYYDCMFPMYPNMAVNVSVMSLPQRGSSKSNTVTTAVTLPDAEGHDAETWRPNVSADNDYDETVLVGRFSLAPRTFKYDQYRVQLKKGYPRASRERQLFINITDVLMESGEGIVTFSDLTNGSYYVWVQPYSLGRPLGRSNKSNIVDISVPVVGPLVHDVNETSKLPLFIGVGCSIVVMAALSVITLACFKRRKRSLHPSPDEQNTAESCPVTSETMKARKVGVLFSDESQEQREVVYSLCTYLSKQCGCQISLIPGKEQTLGATLANLQQCDWVIIINPEETFYKDMVYGEKAQVQKTMSSKDLFAACIDHIRAQYASKPMLCSKFLMVCMENTPLNYLLSDLKEVLPCFELLGGISDLVLTLLGEKDYGHRELPGHNWPNYLGSEEGSDLAVKVKRAQHQNSNDSGFLDGERQSVSPGDNLSVTSVTSFELDQMLAEDNPFFESLDC